MRRYGELSKVQELLLPRHFVRIASPLRADVIFGKDRIARQITEAPRYLIRDQGLWRCGDAPIAGHGHPRQAHCSGSP
jgi:hypothetical protein